MIKKKKAVIDFLRRTHAVKLYFFLRYVFLIPIRVGIAWRYLGRRVKLALKWLFQSREIANFSYNLTPVNKLYLAHTVSLVTGAKVDTIKRYIDELDKNRLLKKHIAMYIDLNIDKFRVGPMVAYGRRLGWYAVVRATKPKIVVETGVDQGLGSCILAEALRKNDTEGKKGRYFGTDILPEAGQLFTGKYRNYGEILYGDSLETLKNFKSKIDVFINDSDHNPKYEAKEYQIISKLLKKSSIVMGDNSHGSPELCNFAERTNRKFIFFKERPEDHWYYGAGIGFAYGRQ